MPEEMKGSADTVLFIRALHNLARFESLLAAALDTAARSMPLRSMSRSSCSAVLPIRKPWMPVPA